MDNRLLSWGKGNEKGINKKNMKSICNIRIHMLKYVINWFTLEEIFGKHSCLLQMSHAHTLKLKRGNNVQLCIPLWLNCCIDWIWCIMLIQITNYQQMWFYIDYIPQLYILSNGMAFCAFKTFWYSRIEESSFNKFGIKKYLSLLICKCSKACFPYI